MPRAYDLGLVGRQLPVNHDPTQRIPWRTAQPTPADQDASFDAFMDKLLTQQWFIDLEALLGNPDLGEDFFDLVQDVNDWIHSILAPTGLVLTEWNLTGLFPGGSGALTLPFALPGTLGGAPVPDTPLQRFIDHVKEFLHADYLDPSFDLGTAVADWLQHILAPSGKVLTEWNLTGLFPGGTGSLTLPFTLPGELGGGPAPDTPLQRFTNNVKSLLTADYTDPSFDLGAAVLDLINTQLLPTGLFAAFTDIDAAIDTAYQQVMDFLTSITGSTPPQHDTWLADLLTAASNLDAAKLINILNIPPIPDANVPGVGQIISNIVNEWLGVNGTWTQADSAAALGDSAATIAALSAAVAALQTTYGQNQTNASLYVVDFTTYPDTANLPSIFNETYTGAGAAGTYGVKGGRARVYPVSDAPRAASGVYNAGIALTDYQIVGGVWTSAPEDTGLGNRGYHILQARSNTAGTTKVYARFAKYSLQLRCVVAGAETVMRTVGNDTAGGGFRFKTNTLYYLLAGTPAGVRTFEVREGSPAGELVLAHTESGTTSQFGATLRSGGVGAQWFADIFGTTEPGAMLYWVFGDNTAPSSLGSTFRARRTSTTLADATIGDNLFPDSWFTVARITNDMVWNPVGNSVTVTIEGTYSVTVRQRLTNMIATNTFHATATVDSSGSGPVVQARTQPVVYPIGNAASAFGGPCVVYCRAGDVIRPGYNASGGYTGAFTAEATGTETAFEVALLNRSLS